jgi:hypothetical protein
MEMQTDGFKFWLHHSCALRIFKHIITVLRPTLVVVKTCPVGGCKDQGRVKGLWNMFIAL